MKMKMASLYFTRRAVHDNASLGSCIRRTTTTSLRRSLSTSSSLPSEAFSVDLFKASQEHLAFLRQIHREQFFLAEKLHAPRLVQPTPESYYAITEASIDRYLHYWLPMIAAHPDESSFIPPHDIAWLWHCHRLAPHQYRQYTIQHFGHVLNPSQPFRACSLLSGTVWNKLTADPFTTYQQVQTQRLWKQHYPEKDFLLDYQTVDASTILSSFLIESNHGNSNHKVASSSSSSSPSSSTTSIDLVQSAHRQGTFLWQVSGKRFLQEPEFRRYAVSRYYAFLKLHERTRAAGRNKYTKTDTKKGDHNDDDTHDEEDHAAATSRCMFVPTYQIDLMWHTHMLWSTTGYRVDCLEICGHDQGIGHDDTFTDRTPGGSLETAFQKTRQAWSAKYPNGQDYFVEGGMYRGEPPARYYSRSWDPDESIKEMKKEKDSKDEAPAACSAGCSEADEGDASSCGSSCGGGCGGD